MYKKYKGDGVEDCEVPHLDIEITEEELKEGLAKVAEVLRPDWKAEEIQIINKSSGYINRNFQCYVPNKGEPFFLRIINAMMPGLVEKAQNAMRYLRRRKLGAQLLLTFKNGLVMEFIEGEVVTWETIDRVKEPEVWLSYAREMAKFHATTDEDVKKFNIPKHEDSMQQLFGMVEGLVASGKIPEEKFKDLPKVAEVKELSTKIYKQMLDAGAEVKFSHMDPNATNLLIRKDKSVVIVDYDECCMDIPCLEMAQTFVGFCGILDFSLDKLPTEEQKDQFLREYLKTRHEIEGKGEVPEKAVEFCKFLLRKANLIIYLVGIVVVIILQSGVTDKPLDFEMCQGFWKAYQEDAEKVLAETFSWD